MLEPMRFKGFVYFMFSQTLTIHCTYSVRTFQRALWSFGVIIGGSMNELLGVDEDTCTNLNSLVLV